MTPRHVHGWIPHYRFHEPIASARRLDFQSRMVLMALMALSIYLGQRIGGRVWGWYAMPVAGVAAWYVRTLRGVLNFLVLQWFGVRLALQLTFEIDGLRRSRWFVLRWVWPLTGWWSGYRWIARRGCAAKMFGDEEVEGEHDVPV